MKEVWYFSAAGHSLEVARFFACGLNAPLKEIDAKSTALCDTAVVVFPVYCQNIPEPVSIFLTGLAAKQVMLIATYGRMGHGNVLREGAELVSGQVIGAAFVPTGHTYLREDIPVEIDALQPLLERIRDPKPISIPKLRKWWLADLFPGFRGRLGVTIRKSQNCSNCGLCTARCPMDALRSGKPGKACIRCLRCVRECPEKALSFTCHPLLRLYLRKPRQQETVIYL